MQYKNKEQKHRINLEATMEYQEQSLGGQIFNRIRDDILSGNYTPGEELKEATLGKQLGVSRTPVREALRQLDLEGLVEIAPNRGAKVIGIYCKTPYLPYGKKRKLSLSSFKNDLFILHLCGNCLFWWFPS